jgi:hypothetical protein
VVHNTEKGLLSKQNIKALLTLWFIKQDKDVCQQRREKLFPQNDKNVNFSGNLWKAVGKCTIKIESFLIQLKIKNPKHEHCNIIS